MSPPWPLCTLVCTCSGMLHAGAQLQWQAARRCNFTGPVPDCWSLP